ncbi:MAG TPA: phosphatase PAP2 family protein [Myxococcota bacterium]|nr:phosphatase PAP2 family protein [Myxococcota bacterium]
MKTAAQAGGGGSRLFWIAFTSGFVLWVALLTVGSSWDLRFSLQVADASAVYGKLVLRFGELPAWLVVAGCVFALVSGRKKGSRLRRLRPLALAVLVVALVEPLLITQSLKFLWGRVRPRNLGPGLSAYTPFYLPAGPGAGESFPSGHVAMAFSVAPLAFYASRYLSRARGFIAWILVLAYGLAVAWGRILAGAHFPSDCIFSAGLTLLVAAVVSATAFREPTGYRCSSSLTSRNNDVMLPANDDQQTG